MMSGRWLPAVGVVIGVSFMVAAVALGQSANPPAPSGMAAGPGDEQSVVSPALEARRSLTTEQRAVLDRPWDRRRSR